MANARRTRPARASAGAASAETADTLRQLRLDMEAAVTKLLLIPHAKLSDEDHEAWSDQITQLNLAIAKVRNAVLEELNDQFQAELPAIQAATAELAKKLERLQQSVAIIRAVDGVLGVVRQIITLLA